METQNGRAAAPRGARFRDRRMRAFGDLLKKNRTALLRGICLHAAALGTGFLLSNVRVGEMLSPFAAAFCAGAPDRFFLSAAIGASLGAFAFHDALQTLKYIGAAVLILLFRAAGRVFDRRGRSLLLRPAAAFFGVLLSAAAILLTRVPQPETVLLALCESLIALAACAFWQRTFALLPDVRNLFSAAPGDVAAALFCGAQILRAGAAFAVYGVSPARMLSFYLLLLFAYGAGETAGALTGIAAGLTLGLTPEQTHLIYALPAAGILCGLARGAGKFATALGFLLCDVLFLILKGEESAAFAAVIEAGVAAAVFLALPDKLTGALTERIRPLSGAQYETESNTLLRIRLFRMAGAAKEIYESIHAVCRLAAKEETPYAAQIPELAKKTACADCSKRAYCWERAGALTKRAFAEATDAVLKNGRLYPDTLPERLTVTCRAADAVCDAFNAQYAAFAARLTVRQEVFEVKETAAAQFRSISGLLTSAAAEICGDRVCEPFFRKRFADALQAAGIETRALSVWTDKSGRYTAETICSAPPKTTDEGALLARIYEKTGVRFAPPVRGGTTEAGAALCFVEAPPLRVDFCKRSAPRVGEQLCGDACEGFADAAGGFCCVLSDGMGSGAEAAVNAGMTCSLLGKLLRAGIRSDAAISAVNAALLVNASEELLATVDICRVDLFTGRAVFLKAGGAASYVRKDGRSVVIERASLPLGILRETKFERTDIALSPDDAIVMMSDGASLLTPHYVKSVFLREPELEASSLCDRFLAEARRRAAPDRSDDVTVACLRVLRSTAQEP